MKLAASFLALLLQQLPQAVYVTPTTAARGDISVGDARLSNPSTLGLKSVTQYVSTKDLLFVLGESEQGTLDIIVERQLDAASTCMVVGPAALVDSKFLQLTAFDIDKDGVLKGAAVEY